MPWRRLGSEGCGYNEKHGSPPVVFTVDHSTRPLVDFIALLTARSVAALVDVRAVPRSRRNPQFDRDTLPASLAAAGIGYAHVAGLGGFRRVRPGSVNIAWRNASFRGFAEYMQTPAFAESLDSMLSVNL